MFHLLDIGRRMKIVGIEELVLQLRCQTGPNGGFARAGYTHENNSDWLIHKRKSFVRGERSSKFPSSSRALFAVFHGVPVGMSSCSSVDPRSFPQQGRKGHKDTNRESLFATFATLL